MSKPLSSTIRRSLESEFPGAEPRPDLWERIQEAVPHRPRPAARLPRWLTATVASFAAVMITGVALAFTPAGQAVMAKFGIRLVPGAELEQALAEKGVASVPGKDVPTSAATLRATVPAGMKLPTYLPESLREVEPEVDQFNGPWMVQWDHLRKGAEWMVKSQAEADALKAKLEAMPKLSIMWHPYVFGPNSRTGTHGEVTELQEITVGSNPAMAYHDDYGWNILVAIEGNQYHVISNISLEETKKVAESLQ